MTKKIAVLPGDGIGPEIVDQAVKVLNALDKTLKWKRRTSGVWRTRTTGIRSPKPR